MTKTNQDSYSKTEAKKRFESALRGARLASPQPMKSMTPKRSKAQRKIGVSKRDSKVC